MSFTTDHTICTRPFEWCEIHPDGSVLLCCPAWLKRPLGNLLRQPIAEIWNGPVAREIRKSILNGSFHNCNKQRCPHLTTKSPPVCRAAEVTDPCVRQALETGCSTLPYLPRILNLCFDHSCNLACPSCRKSVQQARGAALRQAEQISASVRELLLPTAETITLSGFGDPFGSATYLALLRQLEADAYPQLRHLRLHSNGLLLSEAMWQSLPKLNRLISEVEISLDAATEETYRQNRPGGDFQRLLENLGFISEQNCLLTLSMVVQQNNWREIEQLSELAKRFNARLYLSQLVNWGRFSRQEYQARAVHLAGHPEHTEFTTKLQELSRRNRLELGNLRSLVG